VQGVSTRRVDDLAQTLGLNGISKSQVSLLCQKLDTEVERFRSRPLSEVPYPYVWLDATYVKARANGRVAGQAVVIAIGLNAATGQREVLGPDVGPSEDGAFWLAFLRGLVARGLSGVQLVVSDAHEGLKGAIGVVLVGSSWQRCRVHFVRNALALIPKAAAQLVAATIRTVFAQPEPEMARATWRQVADSFRSRYPKLAALLDSAEADVLAYLAFPPEHWRQIGEQQPTGAAQSRGQAPHGCRGHLPQRRRDGAFSGDGARRAARRVAGGAALFQRRIAGHAHATDADCGGGRRADAGG
jgi:putative transposase